VKVFWGLSELDSINNPIVTAGTFDGVHVGHQKIINRLNDIAKNCNGESLLITYHPHPRLVIQPDFNLELLTDINERLSLLEQYGVDNVLVLEFSKEFSRISSLEYIRDIVVDKIGVKKLVIGYDHQFGRNREGGFDQLVEFSRMFNFEIEEIQVEDIDNVNVSSTKIRKAINDGNVEKAKKYLGHEYILSGQVIPGQKIGRKLGYPTANIEIKSENKLLPKKGVYVVKVNIDGKEMVGMLNIGNRPTIVEDLKKTVVEVHILDQNEDFYGKCVEIKFHKRIREEIKFPSMEELKNQLYKDEQFTREAF
jgi:riboflavin kinase/FMN adenylyltransferase